MHQEDLQIRLKVEEMIQYGYAALRQFPKSEKHVMSAEIRRCMFQILRLVIVCNRRYYKKTTMQELGNVSPRYTLCRVRHRCFRNVPVVPANAGG